MASGDPIAERDIENFPAFVCDQLLQWEVEPEDDLFGEIIFPYQVIALTNCYWNARLLLTWTQDIDRSSETLSHLVHDIGKLSDIQTVADAPDARSCLSLLLHRIRGREADAKRAVAGPNGQIARMMAASSLKKLKDIRNQLVALHLQDER